MDTVYVKTYEWHDGYNRYVVDTNPSLSHDDWSSQVAGISVHKITKQTKLTYSEADEGNLQKGHLEEVASFNRAIDKIKRLQCL